MFRLERSLAAGSRPRELSCVSLDFSSMGAELTGWGRRTAGEPVEGVPLLAIMTGVEQVSRGTGGLLGWSVTWPTAPGGLTWISNSSSKKTEDDQYAQTETNRLYAGWRTRWAGDSGL